MSAFLFSAANWTPTATGDAASTLANGTYMALQGATGTQRTNILEVLVEGEASATAVSYLQLAHDSTIGATTTALAAPNSTGPQDPSTGALANPVVAFVAATTPPQRSVSTSLSRLRLTINAWGGIVKWNPWQPNMAFTILGNTASNGEASLSAYTGSSASAQISAHIIYETA